MRSKLHSTLPSSTLYCELNSIERIRCAAKWYAPEHCEYWLDGLRKVLPAALSSVTTVSINRYYTYCVMDTYTERSNTKAFTEHVYKSPRQVVDGGRWWWGPGAGGELFRLSCPLSNLSFRFR